VSVRGRIQSVARRLSFALYGIAFQLSAFSMPEAFEPLSPATSTAMRGTQDSHLSLIDLV